MLPNTHDFLVSIPYLFEQPPSPGLIITPISGDTIIGALVADRSDPERRHRREIIRRLAGIGGERLNIVGYGTADEIENDILAFALEATEQGWEIHEIIRVEADRYWSLSANGGSGSINPEESLIPARAVFLGMTNTPPEEVYDQTKQYLTETPTAQLDMSRAQINEAVHSRPDQGAPLIRDALLDTKNGIALPDTALAFIAAYLRNVNVRDIAWGTITEREARFHWSLWTRATRIAAPDDKANCAAVAGFAAWHGQDWPAAHAAADVALENDRSNGIAQMLKVAVVSGLPPAKWEEYRP